jgi:hypothetical protein
MRTSVVVLLGAAAAIAASTLGASAQVLNLTGQFQCVNSVLCRSAGARLRDANRIPAQSGE